LIKIAELRNPGGREAMKAKLFGVAAITALGALGLATPAQSQYVGFLYKNGYYTTLSVSGAVGTIARGINDSGEVVGSYGAYGYVYSNGNYLALSVPGAAETIAYGINDLGQIVGGSSAGSFLYVNGNYTLFSELI
jgi:uncharacterized membrane protein